jgi:hypothetical protein
MKRRNLLKALVFAPVFGLFKKQEEKEKEDVLFHGKVRRKKYES